MADRPLRLCDVCGQLDDHPRHVTGLHVDSQEGLPSPEFLAQLDAAAGERHANGLPPIPTSAVAELMIPTTIVRHHDCCAAQGCSICSTILGVTGDVTGDELLAVIQSGVIDDLDFSGEG